MTIYANNRILSVDLLPELIRLSVTETSNRDLGYEPIYQIHAERRNALPAPRQAPTFVVCMQELPCACATMSDLHVVSVVHQLGWTETIAIILAVWLMLGWLVGIIWGVLCKW